MEQTKPSQSLPDNAYRELKPGEEYVPMMPADAKPKEVTPYSVTMGLLMAVLFSAAAAYLGLRIGQVFEAAIPIAIIAVGVGNMLGKKNMLGQNVIIQSIGASSGIIVAGAIFTLPALYILGLETAFYKVFLSSVLGGILGIVLLIPFRKYFVKEMHGKYPFPEATATTEVLVSGEKGGNQAKLLAVAGLVGGLYDFAASTFGLWTEEISTRMTAWGTLCADKFKTLLKVNTSAAVLGLGYIIGLKYSAIIAAGSFLIWLLVVPVVGSTATGAGMSPEELYQTFGRPLGIGGIAMAGLIGIIRQSGIIKQAMGLAVSEFSGKKKAETNVPRTQRDLTMRTILTTLIAALATTFFFFQFGILGNWGQTAVALLIVFVISFLFTTVAANAIGNTMGNFHVFAGQAICMGLTTVVSQCVGAGAYDRARYYMKKLTVVAYTVMGIVNLTLILCIPLILRVYDVAPEAAVLAREVMLIHGGSAILLWLPSFMIPYFLRAAGDATFTMVVSMITMWLVRVLGAYVIGRYLGYGVVGVWFAHAILDWATRSVIFYARYRSGKWERMAIRS